MPYICRLMKKDNLKHIISKNIKQETSQGFTQNVMQKVTEESFLKTHLKEGFLQQTSANFTNNVIEKLNSMSVASNYQPVISKKSWSLIGALSVFLILFSFNDSKSYNSNKYLDLSLNFIHTKLNFILQSLTSNRFLIMLFFSISALIFFDILLNSGKSIFKKN